MKSAGYPLDCSLARFHRNNSTTRTTMKKNSGAGLGARPKDQPGSSNNAPSSSASATGKKAGTSTKKQPGPAAASQGSSKAVVPKGQQGMLQKLQNAQMPIKKVNGMYVPEVLGISCSTLASGYRMRVIKPAEKADVVSLARAMNDDFAPKLKQLFDTETAAAIEAHKTGIYIGWRCPDFQHDCQRIFHTSRCFCDHILSDHATYNAMSIKVPCRVPGCPCKAYQWIPNRPEDIGEFWLPKRPDFDPAAWRAKCKCKHTHNFHDPNRPHRCIIKGGCSCGHFISDFLCAACDRHWEDHQTFFDSHKSRVEQGLPVGTDWLPFAEMPDLRNIALSGNEADDSHYLALKQFDAIPSQPASGNNEVVKFKGGQGGSSSRDNTGGHSAFRPTYD